MTFAVTPLYALPLVVIFLILWFRTTSMRGAMKLSIGDGGSPSCCGAFASMETLSSGPALC